MVTIRMRRLFTVTSLLAVTSLMVMMLGCAGASTTTVDNTPPPIVRMPPVTPPTPPPPIIIPPVDSDGDSVADAIDKCPATPAVSTVDANGCILVKRNNILVFSKTASYRHQSIGAGRTLLSQIASENGWQIQFTEESSIFNASALADFDVVIWLSTSGTILNNQQRDAFEDYIENGGGYVGIHAASDTEYDWPWYGNLVGAYFKGHPDIQTANLIIENTMHPSTIALMTPWRHQDEWYSFRTNPRIKVNVLMSVDEKSYSPGSFAMGDHPIAWYHDVGTGRSFYTALGHTDAAYTSSANFKSHIAGGVAWAGKLTTNKK